MVTSIEKTHSDEISDLVKSSNLEHIAIIMDGNRRWAKSKFLPTAAGHTQGVKALKDTVKNCKKFGIKALTVYAFSTENWGRAKEEVVFLMKLLANTIEHELSDLYENNVKIKFIGDLSRFSKELNIAIQNAQKKTENNNEFLLQIAINYGGRDEIKNAVKAIAKKVQLGEINPEDITEETIQNQLYNPNVKEPDLLIRTGGEMRVSNFLLWQIAYSEFYVTPTYWPEFNEEELKKAIISFSSRVRRFGKN